MENLYIVASGIWGQHSNPENTRQKFKDYIDTVKGDLSKEEWANETIDTLFEHDDFRVTYKDLEIIADQKPNWFSISDYDEYFISGSVTLTDEQAEELGKTFYLELMNELI